MRHAMHCKQLFPATCGMYGKAHFLNAWLQKKQDFGSLVITFLYSFSDCKACWVLKYIQWNLVNSTLTNSKNLIIRTCPLAPAGTWNQTLVNSGIFGCTSVNLNNSRSAANAWCKRPKAQPKWSHGVYTGIVISGNHTSNASCLSVPLQPLFLHLPLCITLCWPSAFITV